MEEIKGSQISSVGGSHVTFTIPNNISNKVSNDDIVDDLEDLTNESYVSDTSWPDLNLPGYWGNFGLESNPWNEVKPFTNIRKYEEITLNGFESKGILSERMVASCSSYLDRCPETRQYVLCKCNLSNKLLVDISVLTYHHHLQYLDLSRNKLTNLRPLGQLPFLMYLDVSHNELQDLLHFKPPFNLTYVNYSHNMVDVIHDLSEFWSIVHLDLSYNGIFLIRGLEELKFLRYLNLSHNFIKILQAVNCMRLKVLDLENNEIEFFEEGQAVGLKTLNELVEINLKRNKLKTLKLLKGLKCIRKINLASNNIDSLVEIENLKGMVFLTDVDLRDNPITLMKNYYETCIYIIQSLRYFDGDHIDALNKVMAKNTFDPSLYIKNARKHSQLLLLEQMNNFNVIQSVLPIAKSMPPVIVLVGPPGSGQEKIIKQFYGYNEKHLKLGVSHTTRAPTDEEIEGESYYFISTEEFLDLSKNGEFLSVFEFLGNFYGLSRNELQKVSQGKCALLAHTDLNGAIVLKMRNMGCKFVLLLLSEDTKNFTKIMQKYCYTYWISKNREAIQILNDPTKIPDTEGSIYSEIERVLSELLHRLPVDPISERTVFVKFQDDISTMSDETGTEVESSLLTFPKNFPDTEDDSLVALMEEKDNKRHSLSFMVPEKLFHSISEVQFGSNLLSVVSEAHFRKSDDSLKKAIRRNILPNEHIESFIKKTVALRKTYIDFHKDNPGFFCETIYSDKNTEAIHKLNNLLREVFDKEKKPLHSYDYYKDEVFEDMISDRLKYLHNDLKMNLYVSDELNDV